MCSCVQHDVSTAEKALTSVVARPCSAVHKSCWAHIAPRLLQLATAGCLASTLLSIAALLPRPRCVFGAIASLVVGRRTLFPASDTFYTSSPPPTHTQIQTHPATPSHPKTGGNYSGAFLNEFKIFVAELRDFFNAAGLTQLLENVKGGMSVEDQQVCVTRLAVFGLCSGCVVLLPSFCVSAAPSLRCHTKGPTSPHKLPTPTPNDTPSINHKPNTNR